MWIPRYIDMNPHFSHNILNKGIFRMWIHRYIDMYPHCLDNSNLVGGCIHILLSIKECIQIAWASKVLYCLGRGIYGIREIFRTTYFGSKCPLKNFTVHPFFYNVTVPRRNKNGCRILRRQHLVTLKGN